MLRMYPYAPFLLEASKKTYFFNLPPPTTAHTIRDSDKDIEKMVSNLHEAKVNVDTQRTSPPFKDPVESGWTKVWTTDWLKNALSHNLADDTKPDLEQVDRKLDLDYELADTV